MLMFAVHLAVRFRGACHTWAVALVLGRAVPRSRDAVEAPPGNVVNGLG